MAAMVKAVKKGFVRYAREHYPEDAERIIRKADELFPVLYAKVPDIGGKGNAMAYNLDLLILAVSFYEASDHRIGGEAIHDIANRLFSKYRFVGRLVNANSKWQMNLFRSVMYRKYVPYAKLVEEKLARGEWGNTWRVSINPRNTEEGVCFDLVGCPLADYARANGYLDLLPSLCATDHILPKLIHAKLIRTHTCATGSASCDYWYVGDESEPAKAYANVEMK